MSDRGREQRRPPKGLRYVVYAGLGVVALMMIVLSAAVFLGGQAPAGPDYPGAEFEFTYYPGNETLEVTFVNGSRFTENDTSRLSVSVDDRELSRFPLPAEPGDAVSLGGIEPGSIVRIDWYDEEGVHVQIDRRRVGDGNATTSTAGN